MWFAEEPDYYNRRFNGRGWSILFLEGKHSDSGTNVNGEIYKNKEIVICAKHWKTAQQATNLIHSSLILELGDTMSGMLSTNHPVAFSEHDDTFSTFPERIVHNLREYHMSTPSLSRACLIAMKASQNKRSCYAISKYNLSCDIYSTAAIDLDPFHSENLKLSPFYEDHVLFATCITLAYSAIEELNLQIKADAKNPSKLSRGEWNPKVRSNLENRLIGSGIDIHELFLWSVRGTPRKIDKKRSPKVISRPYRTGMSVRDVEVRIIDAINDASWLRSKISAHGFGQLTPSLSPYDVANVQHLARRLILESLGFWKYWIQEAKLKINKSSRK